MDQLKLIIKVLGPPSEDDLSFINSSKARAYIRALPQQEVSWPGAPASAPLHQQLKGRWCIGRKPCIKSQHLHSKSRCTPLLLFSLLVTPVFAACVLGCVCSAACAMVREVPRG